MKFYVLFFALLCNGFSYAQVDQLEEDGPVNLKSINNKKHEFRIDVLEGLAIPALDVSYEYVLSKYSGFGATINVSFAGDDLEYLQDFAITPYYRQYFFNKKEYGARGFFAEGLLQFASGDDSSNFNEFSTNQDENWSRFGFGFALGQKWVSRNGFVIEISLGAGRYFGNNDEVNAPEAFARGGVNFGYRF